jgi:hypothetical protein
MKKIINVFDLYGKHISLYTRSSAKATTCVGFIFTIISFILLGLILYFESYEIFKREHPNVISYKQNIFTNNSTLRLSNNTFNFFLNIYKDFEKDNFLSYFNILSHIKFEKANRHSDYILVFYDNCTDDDKSHFQHFISNFEFPKMGINLCPRINFANTDLEGAHGFTFYYDIRECKEDSTDCIFDKELYENIRTGEYSLYTELNFVDSQINLLNYDKPYWFQLRQFYTNSWFESSLIELDGSEVQSQALFSFYTPPAVQSQFNIKGSRGFLRQADVVNSLRISFYSNDMHIYIRTYKTFNSAFAISFALFKLFYSIISIILSPIYTYYKNTIIINNNFDYELSTLDNDASNNSKIVSARKELTLELTGIKTKRLTTLLALKNVSLFRYILCRKRNRIKTFYDRAKDVIYKYLSVENVFFNLIEHFKLKRFILAKHRDYNSFYETECDRLIFNDSKKMNNEDLQLDILVDNLYHNIINS